MRSSRRLISRAVVLSLLAVMPTTTALAEDADVETSTSEGSQIVPAGADTYTPKPGNLNSVPEDGSTPTRELAGTESLVVKQILAARPKEDLVICIAGCFSGRDRVVYAQPSAKSLRGTFTSQSMLPADPQKLGAAGKTSQAAAVDPRTPVIVNQTN